MFIDVTHRETPLKIEGVSAYKPRVLFGLPNPVVRRKKTQRPGILEGDDGPLLFFWGGLGCVGHEAVEHFLTQEDALADLLYRA